MAYQEFNSGLASVCQLLREFGGNPMMLTPEQSKQFRAELDLSQRRAAELAGVSRSYLNQFERARWIPTDEFLEKLSSFYAAQGAEHKPDPEESTAELAPDADNATDDNVIPGRTTSETQGPDAQSRRRPNRPSFGELVAALGIVGGVLAATGKLPAALAILKRVAGRTQLRPPTGL